MSDELLPAISAGEADALARRMGQNYHNSIEYYREVFRFRSDITPQQKHDLIMEEVDANRNSSADTLERIAKMPLDEASWHDLESAENAKEGGCIELWTRIKDAAREELQKGQRGPDSFLPMNHTPLDRARYLVLREELAAVWQPKNGIESSMLDQLAEAQTLYLHWMSLSHVRATWEYKGLTTHAAKYEAPRVGEQNCTEFAANMADKFHKMFLRTARALQNMRRFSPVIVQNNGGQVNVGAQQVNVAPNGTQTNAP